MRAHKFHDGDFWAPGSPIGFHRLRVVGGNDGNTENLGHRHPYGHTMELERTEPPNQTVELIAELTDGCRVVEPWADTGDTWTVLKGVQHYVRVPPGVIAYLRCWMSQYDETGQVVDPLSARPASAEPEAW